MKIGLIARAEDRGLGLMSWDAQKYLSPHRVVIADFNCPYPKHLYRYPDAWMASPQLPEYREAVEWMLEDVDVVLTFETPYDYNLYEWAAKRKVGTVCVAMPEYYPLGTPLPTILVNPTDYLQDQMPKGTVVLPWPCDMGGIEYRYRSEPNLWLHVAGQPAGLDRNGTALVFQAFNNMPDQRLLVRSQVPLKFRRTPNIEVVVDNVPKVSDLYQVGDALVMPRRYAGQSLVMNEAQAAGLPLICLDRTPERDWTIPEARIPVVSNHRTARRSTRVPVYNAKVMDVIRTIRKMADPRLIEEASIASTKRASSMSWETLLPEWMNILRLACR